jgi:S1-C subfamily serine protease
MENNNSVCYMATINEIKPIEGADKIELVVVGGWNCIAQKGEQKVGDVVALLNRIAQISPGDEAKVALLRKGKPMALKVQVGKRPKSKAKS